VKNRDLIDWLLMFDPDTDVVLAKDAIGDMMLAVDVVDRRTRPFADPSYETLVLNRPFRL
jgi:hypothetical protein